ncbi:hypothetical protein BGX34_002464, partial [Mortierella sp. NVP85]
MAKRLVRFADGARSSSSKRIDDSGFFSGDEGRDSGKGDDGHTSGEDDLPLGQPYELELQLDDDLQEGDAVDERDQGKQRKHGAGAGIDKDDTQSTQSAQSDHAVNHLFDDFLTEDTGSSKKSKTTVSELVPDVPAMEPGAASPSSVPDQSTLGPAIPNCITIQSWSEFYNLGKSVEQFLERNMVKPRLAADGAFDGDLDRLYHLGNVRTKIRNATAPYVDDHLRFLMSDYGCGFARFVGDRSIAYEILRLYEQDMFDTVVDEFLEQQSMKLWQHPFSLDPSYYQFVGGLTKDRIAEMAARHSRCCVGDLKPLGLKKSPSVDVALQTEPLVVDGAQSAILTDHKDKSAEEGQEEPEEQEDEPLERNNPSRAVLS